MGKAEKTEKTNNKKQKHFWKDFKAELKKVIWPTKSQVVNNTIIVIVIVLIVTGIVFVLDLAFEALNTYGIDKLKTYMQNTVVSEEKTDDSENKEKNSDGNTANNNNEENATNNNQADDSTNVENNITE